MLAMHAALYNRNPPRGIYDGGCQDIAEAKHRARLSIKYCCNTCIIHMEHHAVRCSLRSEGGNECDAVAF